MPVRVFSQMPNRALWQNATSVRQQPRHRRCIPDRSGLERKKEAMAPLRHLAGENGATCADGTPALDVVQMPKSAAPKPRSVNVKIA
jgi:hypothetical protein